MRQNIGKLDSAQNVRNARGKTVHFVTTTELMVHIGTRTEFVTFFTADRLATSVILGSDCDRHVRAINPRLDIVSIGEDPRFIS